MEKDLLKGNCQKVANHKSNNSLSRQNLCIQCLCYVIVDGFFSFSQAVIEGKWPSNTTSSHMWNKLRNFFAAVYELQRLARLAKNNKGGKRKFEFFL